MVLAFTFSFDGYVTPASLMHHDVHTRTTERLATRVNLEICFPELSPRERGRLASASFAASMSSPRASKKMKPTLSKAT